MIKRWGKRACAHARRRAVRGQVEGLEPRVMLATTPVAGAPRHGDFAAAHGLPVIDGTVSGDFKKAREVDAFAAVVADGEGLAVTLTPRDPAIRAGLRVRGPDGAAIAKAAAPKRGEPVTLTLPAGTPPDVVVRARSLAGRGAYELSATVQRPTEQERVVEGEGDEGPNDTFASAQPLDGTAVRPPGRGGARVERMEAAGVTARGAAEFFSFQLAAGQHASVTLAGVPGRATSLALLDPTGRQVVAGLAADRPDAEGELRVEGFVAAAAGVYYARVTGPADAAYGLTVDRMLSRLAGGTPTRSAAAAAPDLVVGEATVPSAVSVRTSFDASWTVLNQGTSEAVAATWWDTVYFSADAVLDAGDLWADDVYHRNLPPLAAGGSYTAANTIFVPTAAAGMRYLLIATDQYFDDFDESASDVAESDEHNNVTVIPIEVATPDVDLIVSTVTAPQSGTLGETVDVSWTVANQGAVPTDAEWYDRFYLSDDATLDDDDARLGYAEFGGPLAAGEAYAASRTLSLPTEGAGARYLLVVADGYRDQPETDEANNVYAVPIDLVAPDVDLTLSAVTAPATAVLGQPITVAWTASNAGTEPTTSNWDDAIYISDDPHFDIATDVLVTYVGSSPLGAGEGYSRSETETVPGSAGTGAKYLLVVADDLGLQAERDEANNVYAVSIELSPPDVDLQVEAFEVPEAAAAGDVMTVYWTVSNSGSEATSISFGDGLYLSADQALDPSDAFIRSFSGSQLAGGSVYDRFESVYVPAVVPGDYFVLLSTDRGSRQAETDESNNVAARPIRVGAPNVDLSVGAARAPASAPAGAPVPISWTVHNLGTGTATGRFGSWYDEVYLSDDPTLGASDRYLHEEWVDEDVPAGGSYSRSGELTVPAAASPGERFLLFVANAYGSYDQAESSDNNNVRAVPFTVEAADTVAPVVIASSIATGATLSSEPLVYEAQFSEPLAAKDLGPADVVLTFDDGGHVIPATGFAYDGATRTVSVTLPPLDHGNYTLALRSSPTGFRDASGNPLDGGPSFPLPSGDGTPGDDFVVKFSVDSPTRAVPTPLSPTSPPGALTYGTTLTDSLAGPDDVDVFTIDVEAGQMIAAMIPAPQTTTLIGLQAEILGSDGAVLHAASSFDGDRPVVAQSVAPADGTYTVRVTAAGGAGRYSLTLSLGTVVEDELFAQVDNDSMTAAQDLAPSAVALQGGADRLAVAGRAGANDDFYRFTLAPGQHASLFLSAPGAARLNLELRDESGTIIAIGTEASFNTGESIDAFTSEAGGTFFARVAGTPGLNYGLVVTRGIGFDFEPNDEGWPYQPHDISGPLRALGYFGAGRTDFTDAYGRPSLEGWTASGLWHLSSNPNWGADLPGHTAPHFAYYGLDATGNYDAGHTAGDLTSPEFFVGRGGGSVSFKYRLETESPFDWFDRAIVEVSPDGWQTWDAIAYKGGGIHHSTEWTAANVDLSHWAGQSVSVRFRFETHGAGGNDHLGWQVDDVQFIGADEDLYTFAAAEGDTLVITTTTPGDGPGEPANSFDPTLELYDPNYGVVVSDGDGAPDGKNARLAYTVPAGGGGHHVVRLQGAGEGAYVLDVAGATPTLGAGPQVYSTTPYSGLTATAAPSTIEMYFSETVRASSVTPDDLVLDGGASATAVELIDGRTVRFTLAVPDVEGTFNYSLPAGAITDLQGQPGEPYSGSFTVDRTGPRVVSHSPAGVAAGQQYELGVTFDEWTAWGSFSLEDVTAFVGPGGVDLLDRVWRVDEGQTSVIRFDSVQEPGTYALTLGPEVLDLAGNPMDQDGDGIAGEATEDAYVATFEIRSPDLRVTELAIDPPSGVTAGTEVTVRWNDQNDGAGVASNWDDHIRVVNETTGQTLLDTTVSFPWWEEPLEPGAARPREYRFRLPDRAPGSGNLRVTVTADVHDYEAEYDADGPAEDNNEAVIEFTSALPDYPDLTVTDITAPQTATDGQQVQVSWTLTNHGTLPAVGPWYDSVYLSEDAQAGGGDDQLLGHFEFNGTIPPNESLTRTQVVTLPVDVSGARRVVVHADRFGHVLEFEEVDNALADDTALDVTLSPSVDLVVADVNVPVEAVSGRAMQFSWTVRNDGDAPAAGPRTDAAYLSADDIPGNEDDVLLGHFNLEGAVGVGEVASHTVAADVPLTLGGPYRLLVRANVGGAPSERNKANNTTLATVLTTIKQATIPNLQPTAVTAPSTAFSGREVEVAWTVENRGDGPTSAAAWYDRVYLSTDAVLDGSDRVLGEVQNPSYLEGGQGYVSRLSARLPREIEGPYYVLVVADAYGHVFEHTAGEADNVAPAAGPIEVALTPPPDLRVTTLTRPARAFSGQAVQVGWTVQNLGAGPTDSTEAWWVDRVYLSTDDTWQPTDLQLGELRHDGALAKDGAYSASLNVRLPVGLTGPRYLIVRTDDTDRVFEHAFEGNNAHHGGVTEVTLTPPPDLAASLLASPSTAQASHALTARYRVENEGSSATVNIGWTDALYLSADAAFDPAVDLLIGTRAVDVGYQPPPALVRNSTTATRAGADNGPEDNRQNQSLLPGEAYVADFTGTVPDGLSGSYYLLVVADDGNREFELDDVPGGTGFSANVTASSTPVTIESRPADLVVSGIEVPASAQPGTGVPVSWTVANRGTGDSVALLWNDAVYLSLDQVFGNGDDRLLSTFTGYDGRPKALPTLTTTSVGADSAGAGPLAAGASYARTGTVALPADLSGPVFLFVAADVNGRVYEGAAEGNNASSAPVALTAEGPDLRVTSVTAPATALSGDTVSVSWTTRNAGDAPVRELAWSADVYLSADAVIDSGDRLLERVAQNGPLAAGAELTTSRSFVLPAEVTGDFRLIVRADSTGVVFEGTEGPQDNDRAAGAVTQVLLRPVPDLRATDVDGAPEALGGQPIRVSWTVVNQGQAASPGGWDDNAYLSLDQVLDSADVFLGFRRREEALAAGASYARSETFTVPRGLSGPYYVFVKTDAAGPNAQGTVFERGGEGNNAALDPLSTQLNLMPPADLVAGTLTVPANAFAGQAVTLTYSVSNQGTEAARGSWYDSLYLSADDRWDIADALIGRVLHEGDVVGGGSYSGTLTAPLPGVLPADYRVIVRSDIRNNVPESDESNNFAASLEAVSVDATALTLGTPVAGSVPAGQSAYYKVDVPAGETLVVHFDAAEAGGYTELFVARDRMPSRSSADAMSVEPFTPDQRVLVPDAAGGTYYILAHAVNTGGAAPTAYSLTASTVRFAVFDEGYGRGGTAGNLTIRINGTGLDRATGVTLSNAAGFRQPAGSIGGADEHGTRLFATFDLRTVQPGTYDVTVADDRGESITVAGGLEVVAGGGGNVSTHIDAPSAVRSSRAFTFTVYWANDGLNDALAPVLAVGGSSPFGPEPGDHSFGNRRTFLALPDQSTPGGIMRPGESGSVTFYGTAGPTQGTEQVYADQLFYPVEAPTDWSPVREDLRSLNPDETEEKFNAVFAEFQELTGPANGDFLRALATTSSLLPPQIGDPIAYRTLLARLWQRAKAELGGSIHGRVEVPDAPALAISALVVARNGAGGAPVSTHALNDGTFYFSDLPNGAYTLALPYLVQDPATVPQVALAADQVVRGLQVRGAAGKTLDLVVRSAVTGLPVAQAFVAATSAGDPGRAGETDGDGRLRLKSLPDGEVSLYVSAEGYATLTVGSFDVGSGSTDLLLRPQSQIRGAVVTAVPLAEDQAVTVMATRDDDPRGVPYATTVPAGAFTLDGLPAGTYSVRVSVPGYAIWQQTVEVSEGAAFDVGTIDLDSTPARGAAAAELSAREFGDDLDIFEAWFTPVLLASVFWARGFEFQEVTHEFLQNSAPTRPWRFFGEESETVEGTLFPVQRMPGFRWHPAGHFRMQQAFDYAVLEIEEILQGWDSQGFCEEWEATFTLEQLLKDRPLLLAVDGNSDNEPAKRQWTFGQTLAGGVGHGGWPPERHLVPDSRRLTGSIKVQMRKDGTAVATSENFLMTVIDTYDFFPGNLGPDDWVGRIATNALTILEINGRAYDIPVEVKWADPNERTKEIKFPGKSCCDGEDCGPCKPEPGKTCTTIDNLGPGDPNDIVGPAGFGDARWVQADAPLGYTIRFENDPDIATAPAQVVRITQKLDADLDVRTFRLGDFGFGDTFVDVPDGRAFHQDRLDLRDTHGLYLEVAAGIDVTAGEAFWEFRSLDPLTGDLPDDPLVGFLPVNVDGTEGQAFVNYTVKPKRAAATGHRVDAQARIVFDTEAPIDTPAIFNTLDAGKPQSTVETLPPAGDATQFSVRWSGSDDPDGSGLSGFDVYVSDNGGLFVPWLTGTALTEATFAAQPGHSYAFYSVARDNAGNQEEKPLIPDAVIQVANVAPVVDLGPSTAAAVEGAVFTRAGSFADAGAAGTWTATVDYGEGAGPQPLALALDKTFSLSHAYADNGAYTVTVTVADTAGAVGTASFVVDVANAAPTAVLNGGGATVAEGAAGADFAFTDPADVAADVSAGLRYSFDFGDDGTFEVLDVASPAVTAPASLFADGPGTRVVRGRVADKDGGATEYTATFSVENVAPAVAVVPDVTVAFGQRLAVAGSFADPGADEWTATVDYGDGGGPQPLAVGADRTFALDHVYALPGEYVVTVAVTDDEGAPGDATFAVTVTAPPGVSSVAINDGNSQRSKVNSIVVTFDKAVTPDSGAFLLTRRDGTATGTTVTVGNPSGDSRTYVLTFSGTRVTGGSLADGIYDLRVIAAKVHAGGGTMTADSTFEFHRLFGDANGDGDSDNGDAVQMGRTFNLKVGDPGFLWYWDYNGDGDVDNGDVVQVRPRRSIVYKGY